MNILHFEDDYLIGLLDICYGTDVVELAHKINGRITFMELGEGDHIEVKTDKGYKAVTVNDILETQVQKQSKQHTKCEVGRSLYQGQSARVKINNETTKKQILFSKKRYIRQIFREVANGSLNNEEAEKLILRIDTDIDD